MNIEFHDIPLFWVEPDPDRERAADPLGLSTQADHIAGRLLPGMSVNTRRARYLAVKTALVRRLIMRGTEPGQLRDELLALARRSSAAACPPELQSILLKWFSQ